MTKALEILSRSVLQEHRETQATFEKERFRVRVFDGNTAFGDFADGEHMLFLEFQQNEQWFPILFIHEDHLWKIQSVIDEVSQYIDDLMCLR